MRAPNVTWAHSGALHLLGLLEIEWVILGDHSGGSTHVSLEAKIFLVTQAVGTSLEDADFVVEAFNEKRDFVFRPAVGGDAVPVAVDHIGEALVGSEALPLEETPRPSFAPVVPELAEGLNQRRNS
jgi:hypothetical protein